MGQDGVLDSPWGVTPGFGLPEGLSPETARRVEEALRYIQRVELPRRAASDVPEWFCYSPRLNFLLASCAMTGVNNPHVNTTLLLPEGRHLKLALVIRECHASLADSGVTMGLGAFSRIALELSEPADARERFASELFGAYLSSAAPGFSLAGEGSPRLLHERLVCGLGEHAFKVAPSYDPARAEELACRILEETEGHHVLLCALMRLHAFCALAPYDIGNAFIGRMVYAQTLREGGMALMSYLPILGFSTRWRAGEALAPSYQPPLPWVEACANGAHGTRDVTRRFEEGLRFLADEAWWFSNKLSRMAERRRRLEELFGHDGAHSERQRAVLVEAYVHDDAEFTFDGLAGAYGVAYSTAHDDLCALEREGFLEQVKSGRRAYFIAVPGLQARVRAHLAACAPARFGELFHEDGRLRGVPIEPWSRERALRPAVSLLDCSDDWRAPFPHASRERRLLITKDHHR